MLIFIGKNVRGCLGLMAWMALTIPLFLWSEIHGSSRYVSALPSMPLSIGLRVFQYPVIGSLCGIAWWSLRKGKPSAQIWTLIACVSTLPSMGVFSYVGIAGLLVFWKKDVVAAMATGQNSVNPPKHVQGDGTHRYIDAVIPYLVLGALWASSLFWHNWGARMGLPSGSGGWIRSWVIFLAAVYTGTILHELGHFLAGISSDMTLRAFQIGPVSGRIESARWRFRFHAAGLLGGGSVGMVPQHLKNIRSRIVVMILGGPMASLVTGATALVLTLTAPYFPWRNAWQYLSLVGSLGLIDFVVNLIPQRPESHYSDGSQIYQIVNGGLWADRHLVMATVGSSSVTKLEPRNWDTALLERAADHQRTGPEGILLRLFVAMHHLNRGNRSAGVTAFREAMEQDPKATEALDGDLLSELTFLEAAFGGDLDRARDLWRRMETKGGYKKEIDYAKGRSSLLCREGKLDEAEEALRVGERFAEKLPDVGVYNFDRWCLAQVRNQIDEAREQRRIRTEMSDQLQQLSALLVR